MRATAVPKALKPFEANQIKVLLLENVNKTAVDILVQAGYQVEQHAKALPEDVLKEKIRDVHAIGIRSKTKLSADILREARNLLVVGCFCIGTNQVDLDYAARHGIAVFNSPFSNSRSVAELVLCEIIALARQLGDRNTEMHSENWNKVSANCYEIRGKTLGIIGYGHIGSQLSVMADAMGMSVIFYDVLQIMPLGTARPMASLEDVLSAADFVTLHVPETPETMGMIDVPELSLMKKGSYLINASRGTVVNLKALASALQSGHIGGAAVDVYPEEPHANGPHFKYHPELLSCRNVIMTPHIGGSTEEAQSMIGIEVATAIHRYVNYGTTLGSVNLPEVDLRVPRSDTNTVRMLCIHHNVPGVLKQINKLLEDHNIEKQICDSRGDVAYVMADLAVTLTHETNMDNLSGLVIPKSLGPQEAAAALEASLRILYDGIGGLKENVRTRMLY
ncbi:D-3-phosphoglycerate dehydrogenase 2 [Sorochytrium milnesiophthora]